MEEQDPLEVKKQGLFNDLIRALSLTLDFEDGEKLSHAWRVAILAWNIGKVIGYKNPGVLYYAGLLHDIGAINLDNHILHYVTSVYVNPLVHSHTDDGERILSPFKPFKQLLPIIKNHHEHYDGTGFPRGLSGDAIPLGSSIILAADIIDVYFRDTPEDANSKNVIILLERLLGRELPSEVAEAAMELFLDLPDLLPMVFSDESIRHLLFGISPKPLDLEGITHVQLLTQLLWVFARIIDSKHTYTMGHSVRTTWLACRISDQLPENAVNKWDLIWAALLHDAGNVGVPRAILNKTSSLTPFEWLAVKKHASDTMNILSSIKELEYLAYSAGSSHEWYDGSGYPYENSGEDIPLIGRIIALADAYDAMRSERPHRKAMSHYNTISEIERMSGTQFDPGLTGLAIEVFNDYGEEALNLDSRNDSFFSFFENDEPSLNAIIDKSSKSTHSTIMSGESGVILLQLEAWLRVELSLDFNIIEGIQQLEEFSKHKGGESLFSWVDEESQEEILKLNKLKEGETATRYVFTPRDTPFEAIFIRTGSGFTLLFRSAKNRIESFKGLTSFYRNFLSSSEAVVFTDKNGVITDVNRKYLDLYGIKLKNVIGKKSGIVKSNETPVVVYEEMWRAIGDKKIGSWSGEITNQDSMGKKIIVSLNISSIKDASGKLLGYIGNSLDITEKKHAMQDLRVRERELSETNKELQKLNNLKSDMVAITSHDLKSPINTILTITGFLKENLETMEKGQVKYFIDQIEEKGEKSIRFISDMLDLAKMETGTYVINPSKTDLGKLLHSIVQDHHTDISTKGLNVEFVEKEQSCLLYADGSKLTQVFNNLLGNAIKFSPQDGELSISCSIIKEVKMRIVIEDNGIGIAEKDLFSVFDKYYQVNKDDGRNNRGFGSGLGLYIVKNIVDIHDGEVWAEQIIDVDSTDGDEGKTIKGTRMVVELPLFRTPQRVLCLDLPLTYRNSILQLLTDVKQEHLDLTDGTILEGFLAQGYFKTILLGDGPLASRALRFMSSMETKKRPFSIFLREGSSQSLMESPCDEELTLPLLDNELLMILKDINNEKRI
jgi:PAS domain S-box-containing protein